MFNGAGVPLKCNDGGDGFTWIILILAGRFDHENRKTPISKPAANAQRPKVQAETTRTRLRRSSSEISWDRSVIAAAPLRRPLGYGENPKTVILAQKKAIDGLSKFRY
jgi:hypothetical protein